MKVKYCESVPKEMDLNFNIATVAHTGFMNDEPIMNLWLSVNGVTHGVVCPLSSFATAQSAWDTLKGAFKAMIQQCYGEKVKDETDRSERAS